MLASPTGGRRRPPPRDARLHLANQTEDELREMRLRLPRDLQYLSVARGAQRVRQAQVCDDREPHDAHLPVYRHYVLCDHRHAHDVAAYHPQEPVLGRRLEVRPRDADEHALAQADLLLERDLLRELDVLAVVRLRHVREARPELVVVGADEGIVARQVDLVHETDDVALVVQRVHSAGRAGEDELLRPERAKHPDREGHLLHRVALVVVDAAVHERHAPSPDLAEHELAGVPLHPGLGEVRDVAERYARDLLHVAREVAEAASEHDGDLGLEVGLLPYERYGLVYLLGQREDLGHVSSCSSWAPRRASVARRLQGARACYCSLEAIS